MLQIALIALFKATIHILWMVAHGVNHAFEMLLSKSAYESGECCFISCPTSVERYESWTQSVSPDRY